MPPNHKPIFVLKPRTARARITSATTDKTGGTPDNLVELVVGATDATKVTQIKFKHVGNSTAGLYLIFISDSAGANLLLYAEIPIAAVTSSNTVATNENTLFTPDLQLDLGQKIFVGATTATSNIHVTAQVGDF